jgi:hypothetical protein
MVRELAFVNLLLASLAKVGESGLFSGKVRKKTISPPFLRAKRAKKGILTIKQLVLATLLVRVIFVG